MQVYSKPFHGEAFAQGLGGVVGSAAGVQAFLRVNVLGTELILLQFPSIAMSLVGLEGRHSRCLSYPNTWSVSQISLLNLTLQWGHFTSTAMYIYDEIPPSSNLMKCFDFPVKA